MEIKDFLRTNGDENNMGGGHKSYYFNLSLTSFRRKVACDISNYR